MTRSAQDYVVNRNEKEFDYVADSSHDCESDGAGGSYFLEFLIDIEVHATSGFSQTSRKRLLAP